MFKWMFLAVATFVMGITDKVLEKQFQTSDLAKATKPATLIASGSATCASKKKS